MDNIGHLAFGNDEVKQNLLSLTENEMKEFEADLASLLQKTNEQMKKDNFYQGHHFANQRLGEQYFRVELWVDLTPNKEPYIYLQQFKKLNIDDYLDSINEDKKLKKNGYRLLP